MRTIFYSPNIAEIIIFFVHSDNIDTFFAPLEIGGQERCDHGSNFKDNFSKIFL